MTYTFTFLRHGESTGNQRGLLQGQKDFPLSQTGIEQSKKLAERWQSQGQKFDTIIASPLSRARQTAEIINSAIQSLIKFDDIWKERSCGALEGTPQVDDTGHSALPISPELYEPLGEGGESEWQLYLRAGHAVQSLFKNQPGNYLVVSHGGLLNKVLAIIAGIKPEASYQGHNFILGNTGYAKVVYDSRRNDWQFHGLVQTEFPFKHHRTTENTYRFFFVRHAESEGNIGRIFQGQMETQLTPEGINQAKALGGFLVNQDHKLLFDGIISSPLLRAKKTADIINEELKIPVNEADLLKEINNGSMEGLSIEEINQKFPERLDRVNPYHPLGDHGESWFELYLRGGRAIDHLLSQPPGTYLIVSHGAILNSTIWSILGVVPQPGKRPPIFRFGNTGFAEMVYSPKQKLWRMLALMAPDHYLTFID